jgi:hypothetical protein
MKKILIAFMLTIISVSYAEASDYGVIIKENVSFEIKDSIVEWNKENNQLWIYLFPFEIKQEEKIKAINNPYGFTLETNSKIRRPDKWPSYTPTAFITINLKDKNVVETYTVGENWILEMGDNSSISNQPRDNHNITLRELELKENGIISFHCEGSGEVASKYLQWKIDFKGKINKIK